MDFSFIINGLTKSEIYDIVYSGEIMKTGLILEGGAMRGLFTAGVTDVMMENGVKFDGMIGVSAGAAFGCNYKSGQIGRAFRYNTKYCRDKRYCSIRSLIKTGDLYGADFCYHELPQKLDIFDTEAFEKNPMEFYVVCTDADTGEPVYKKCERADYECLEWMRASASMPIASKVVKVGGYRLLDGGLSDSVPVEFFESIGYDRNIVVLTQPADYFKKKSPFLPFLRYLMKDAPGAAKALLNRHEDYNRTMEYIKQREDEGNLLVIRPPNKLKPGKIEHNPQKLKDAYNAGREEATKRIAEIKEFLNQ